MSESAMRDTFGSRVGLTVIIAASILLVLFTWLLIIVMGGETKRAVREFDVPGYPDTNMSPERP